MITSCAEDRQIAKFKFCQYQITGHFAKFNGRQVFLLYTRYLIDWKYNCSYTCEKVREELTFFFFIANIREDTISLALEHIGVITNDK